MDAPDIIRNRIAKSLVNQRDTGKRKRLKIIYVLALLGLFALHHFFTNLETPLKLIPQMMSAIGIGYLLLHLMVLRQFPYVAEFIDWPKVEKELEQGGAGQPDNPPVKL